mmetsp:Transcript_3342/g.6334  ORF Transcript_3342/g.6334 Transcript_3342/m.6334 type:complete len:131 (-) Transcript_3342:4269-4661(-)
MCKCNPNIKLYHNADESWSSKVCGGCGEPDYDLGAKKTHSCKCCGISQRRDGGAARTILIKFIFQKIKEKQAFISSPNNLLWFHFCVHLEISILTCSLDTSLFGYFELCCTLMLCGHVCGRLGLVRFGTF